MKIPQMKNSGRAREFNQYDDIKKARILYLFLFKGLTHRELDKVVLDMDPFKSKGFQSMGVLHYLGLKQEFRHIFQNIEVDKAIEILNNDQQDFSASIKLLQIRNTKTLLTQNQLAILIGNYPSNSALSLHTCSCHTHPNFRQLLFH